LRDVYELVEVMSRLRAENGCPWDREQNHTTLKPYLVEETYEVLDAIERNDDDSLKEELGDLLLQIVFHAQIAQEDGRFTIDDVAASIVEKLKRRHPHVFGTVRVDTSEEVLHNWEQIKRSEGKESVLDGVPKGLPALLKARRVQEKVRRVGFDWETAEGAMHKVGEEIKELEDAVHRGKKDEAKEEFGDLLFSLVNVSRFLGIDAEDSLRRTIDKVIERFKYIEREVKRRGSRSIGDYTLDELDSIWERSKGEE
jgi:tetrapyrrole methylase family protein/MazG family protein